MSRYRFIHAERANYPITILCRVLDVARSAYYAWARRGVSARARADEALTAHIAAAYARSRRTYGAPRIHAALRAQGVRCARKRVAHLMRGGAGRLPPAQAGAHDDRRPGADARAESGGARLRGGEAESPLDRGQHLSADRGGLAVLSGPFRNYVAG